MVKNLVTSVHRCSWCCKEHEKGKVVVPRSASNFKMEALSRSESWSETHMVPLRKMWREKLRSIIQMTLMLKMEVSGFEVEVFSKRSVNLVPLLLKVSRAIAYFRSAYDCGSNCLDIILKYGLGHEIDVWMIFYKALSQLENELSQCIVELGKIVHRELNPRLMKKVTGSKEMRRTLFNLNVRSFSIDNWDDSIKTLINLTLEMEKIQTKLESLT